MCSDRYDKIDKKLDDIHKSVNGINIQLAEQNKDISQNTKDLSVHIEGVRQNRHRIEKLEIVDAKTIMIWKVLLGIGSLSAIALTIIRLIKG